MKKVIIKDKNGREVWCYGKIEWDSNFEVVCEDEFNDFIIAGLQNSDGESVTTWKEVVDQLYEKGWKDMEQLSTC